MRGIKSRLCALSVMILLAVAFFGCGKASQTGYNAPTGSTVTLPSDETISADTTTCWIVSLSVDDPDGNPANGIQVRLTGNYITLYDKTSGDVITSESVLEQKALPYFIQTNDRGLYEVEVCVPAPVEVGLDQVVATLRADIGVASDTMSFTVDPLTSI